MNLVDEKGSIITMGFIFKDKKYKVVGTESRKSIWDCIDEVVREDGMRRKFTRRELKNYFTDIVVISI